MSTSTFQLSNNDTVRPATARVRKLSSKARELRFCRHCYRHLAGQVGTAITQSLLAHGYLLPAPGKQFDVTPDGAEWFNSIGIDVQALKPTRRGLAQQCLDWTERSPHLAGPLGTELLRVMIDSGWVRHVPLSRNMLITPEGWARLKRHLDLGRITP